MKVFFQTLLPKTGRAEALDARIGGSNADERAAPIKGGASGKPASPVRAEDDANGRPRLALEAGDFIDRVPHHLLRFGNFDLHRPLLFDLAEVADRIARGSFTIPLSDLLKAIPEMFADDAQALHALEIRFPWQRVMQMVNESAAAHKESGGETLAEKLRRLRKPIKTIKPAETPAQRSPLEARRESVSQLKRGAGRDGENAWFSKRAITFDGAGGDAAQVGAAAAAQIPEVPDSAPALFELPESRTPRVSAEPRPPVPTAPTAPLAPTAPIALPVQTAPAQTAPVRTAAAPVAAAPVPNRQPISDIMNLTLAKPAPAISETAGAVAEKSAPAPIAAPVRAAAPVPTAAPAPIAAPVPPAAAVPAKSGAGDSDQKMNKTRITFLEAQLKTVASKHQNDLSTLNAETESLLGKMRAEKEKERQELIDQFNAERDHAAGLLSREQQRVVELESRLEFDLFALRVESAQIVAEEREKTQEKIAELEARFAQERAGWQHGGQSAAPAADHAAPASDHAAPASDHAAPASDHAAPASDHAAPASDHAAPASDHAAPASDHAAPASDHAAPASDHAAPASDHAAPASDHAAPASDHAAPASDHAAPASDHGQELARLREEVQAAQELAAAQAAAHEKVAAQWEEDVQNYRKRILAVLNEKTALTAKLREAESALHVAVGSAVSNAA